jgi:small subunit ribosomal protein S18
MAYVVRKRLNAKCPFCEELVAPSYGEAKRLKAFMTEKGKIISRSRSGVCQKHQRQLALAVKRARHLALLPYVSVLH